MGRPESSPDTLLTSAIAEVLPRPISGVIVEKKILIALVAALGTIAFMDLFNICPVCRGDGQIGEVSLAQTGVATHSGEIVESGRYTQSFKPETCPLLFTFPWLHTGVA